MKTNKPTRHKEKITKPLASLPSKFGPLISLPKVESMEQLKTGIDAFRKHYERTQDDNFLIDALGTILQFCQEKCGTDCTWIIYPLWRKVETKLKNRQRNLRIGAIIYLLTEKYQCSQKIVNPAIAEWIGLKGKKARSIESYIAEFNRDDEFTNGIKDDLALFFAASLIKSIKKPFPAKARKEVLAAYKELTEDLKNHPAFGAAF